MEEKDLETFDDILLEKLYDVCRILFDVVSYMPMTDKIFDQQSNVFKIMKELSALRKEKKL
jgi:hypothetical protein